MKNYAVRASGICIALRITRKPNSMIVLLFIHNISRALKMTKCTLLSVFLLSLSFNNPAIFLCSTFQPAVSHFRALQLCSTKSPKFGQY